MKKILIISDSFPNPPRNGMELPISKAVNFLNNKYQFDLLIVNFQEILILEKYRSSKNVSFNKIHFQKRKKVSFLKKVIDEFLLKRPFFSNLKVEKQNFNFEIYDFIWVSSTRNVGYIYLLKDFLNKTVLTINDSNYYTYYERIKTLFNGKEKISINKIFNIIRLPFLILHEMKYLKMVSKIHVQTLLEKKRTVSLSINPKKIQVIQNGIDNKLMSLKYEGNSKNILLMSHMTEGREFQTYWFLNKIWPKILNFNNSTKLLIVGTMPKNINSISKNYTNVIFKNYVNELSDAYKNVALSVIPHYQSSGFINRLSDTISAGVPTIISRKISLTYPHFIHNKHGFVFDDSNELINFINRALNNKKLRMQFSKNLSNLATEQPSWESYSKSINKLLLK